MVKSFKPSSVGNVYVVSPSIVTSEGVATAFPVGNLQWSMVVKMVMTIFNGVKLSSKHCDCGQSRKCQCGAAGINCVMTNATEVQRTRQSVLHIGNLPSSMVNGGQ